MTEDSPFDPPPPFASVHLVGRQPQQEALRRCLDAALAGTGSLVLIAGEAGIGKTALVDWITDLARRGGMLALTGRCYDLSQTPPYGPWREALANLPAFAADGDPFHVDVDSEDTTAAGQERLFARVRETVQAAAAAHPAVLVLEDMHWSDPASLDLLRMLGRGLHDLPVLLIVTYRADELTRRHPLHQLLPLLVREARAVRLDVPPLPRDAIAALVASRYALPPADATRLVEHLLDRGGGNPFYVGEVLRTLAAEGNLRRVDGAWQLGELDARSVPPLVRQTIERRLETLDADTRRLLEIAATIGEEAPQDLWQAIAGADRARVLSAIGRARETALIEDRADEPCLRFRHALIRETLYHGQDPAHRLAAHRRIAETLVNRCGVASAVAAHFAHANDPRAVEWLIRAGEEALALYAADDAIAALTRAQEIASRFARDLPPSTYRARAAAATLRGEFDRARRDLELALDRGRALDDRQAEWQALLDLGMLWAERDYQRTIGYYRAALALARDTGDDRAIAHGLNRVANWHVNRDEPDEALLLHAEALARFRASADRRGIADTLDFLALASYLDADFRRATAFCEEAAVILRELDDRQRLSSCLSLLAVSGGDVIWIVAPPYRETSFWLGASEEALSIARAIGWKAGEAFARICLGMVAVTRGELGRALREAELGLEIAERIGHEQWRIAALQTLATVRIELLDPAGAVPLLEQALAAARVSGSWFWTNTIVAILASLRVSLGDLTRAAAILDTAHQPRSAHRSLSQRQCRFAEAELTLARGDAKRALAIVDELFDTRPDPRPDDPLPQLWTLRGDALARLDRAAEADAAYQSAADAARLLEFFPILWRVEQAQGVLLAAQGRAADAEACLRAARATLDRMAAAIEEPGLQATFRARARSRLLLVAAPTAVAVGDTLSPREREVLRHLVDGKTDREIAEALFISPRTVMRHVASILAKLGVSSRTAAAARAVREEIV
jgi:DNA-binding CsgD family transcriptional regulator